MVILAIYFLVSAACGLGDMTLVSGKLKVVEEAEDGALHLSGMGPVILREAEMYQHTKNRTQIDGNPIPFANIGFSNEWIEDFDAYATSLDYRLMRGATHYHNPDFPAAFLNEYGKGTTYIYGVVEIGDEGVKLDNRLLRFFDGQSYSMENHLIPATKTPVDAGAPFGLVLTDPGVYASRTDESWKVGDLKVTYRMVDPKVLEGEFTAIGTLNEDGVLECGEDGALFDRIVTMEEAEQLFQSDLTETGLIFLGVGLLFIGISAACIIAMVR